MQNMFCNLFYQGKEASSRSHFPHLERDIHLPESLSEGSILAAHHLSKYDLMRLHEEHSFAKKPQSYLLQTQRKALMMFIVFVLCDLLIKSSSLLHGHFTDNG